MEDKKMNVDGIGAIKNIFWVDRYRIVLSG
jgi:hypothetical protein